MCSNTKGLEVYSGGRGNKFENRGVRVMAISFRLENVYPQN